MEQKIKEFPAFKLNGFMMLAVVVAIALVGGWYLLSSVQGLEALLARGLKVTDFIGGDDTVAEIIAWLAATLLVIVIPSLSGFFSVEPNQAVVLVLFGKYMGTVRESGFWWTNPFASKHKISLRVRNFNSKIIKVNDAEGSPIEIAAVVVWQVFDSAKSKFAVDDYEEFVAIQSETAIRSLAIRYPYDSPDETETPSLRGIPDEIAHALQKELQARLEVTGVEVIEARLSHLAYAPEIAQMMLRRQQAKALIDARRQIVEGAVGMVNEALNRLSQEQMIDLDNERKASMINNLLVVLTSEQTAQPVINAGTLYN
ncbi:SPFH domain-containing protein [Chlorogloeopsis fritschii PCC 9212]|uniref:Membrane protein n=1 Tax=Chlorogloeopsis fritschii PCC 6912 TaxID=211165 RepID=A0A433N330_CHLFR|nr:SPFH domain-containing protein [Chlorogloeopsis fritschii]RUR75575.1 membrane protein [Chlorogloeopsis fritschii PCC 6912]